MSEKPYPVGMKVIVTHVDPCGCGEVHFVNLLDVVPAGEWVMTGAELILKFGQTMDRETVQTLGRRADWLHQEVHRVHEMKQVIMLPVRWLKPFEDPDGDELVVEDQRGRTISLGRLLEEA
jgi:hypothetical protein